MTLHTKALPQQLATYILLFLVAVSTCRASERLAVEPSLAQSEQRQPKSSKYHGRIELYELGSGIDAPIPIHAPDATYTEEARHNSIQGKVLLWVVIDSSGKPREIMVAHSCGSGLDQSAVATFRQWTFEPALKDGRPVFVQMYVAFAFPLGQGTIVAHKP